MNGAVTFDETEKAREKKKKVPLSEILEMRQSSVEFLRNSPYFTGFFYRRLWGSTYFCTPHAPNSTLLA